MATLEFSKNNDTRVISATGEGNKEIAPSVYAITRPAELKKYVGAVNGIRLTDEAGKVRSWDILLACKKALQVVENSKFPISAPATTKEGTKATETETETTVSEEENIPEAEGSEVPTLPEGTRTIEVTPEEFMGVSENPNTEVPTPPVAKKSTRAKKAA